MTPDIGMMQNLPPRDSAPPPPLWGRVREVGAAMPRATVPDRQSPFGSDILDLVSHERNVVIEVDGGQHTHGQSLARDFTRDQWLRSQGCQVFRYSNLDVLGNLDGVLESLVASLCDAAPPLPAPPPQGGREKKVRSSRR